MPGPLVTAAAAAGIVGGVHAVAHTVTGEERYFDEAGVMWAGLAISAATFAVTWAVASTQAPAAQLVPSGILGNPVWALLIGLVALIAFVLVMNRGRWWFLNVLAQREPAVAALGVALLVWNAGPVAGVGVRVTAVVGALLVALGLGARYTERLDL